MQPGLRRLLCRLRRRVARGGLVLLGRAGLRDERGQLLALLALVVVLAVGSLLVTATWIAPSAQVVPVVLGVLLLRLRSLRLLLLAVVAAAVVDAVVPGHQTVRVGSYLVEIIVAAVAYCTVAGRERLGITGNRADAMLGELRDRLLPAPPPLPEGWALDAAVRTAGGTAFGGDFLVVDAAEGNVELALVDVSGQGVAAGTRALNLSGAFAGLLGSVPAEAFLAQANRYVVKLDWNEGFATAVHVRVDCSDGAFELRSAGHLPAAMYTALGDRWSLLTAEGSGLGFVPGAHYPCVRGRLLPGDGLLLYTDGVVEVSGRELSAGIDLLLAAAGQLARRVVADRSLETATAPPAPDTGGDAQWLLDTVAPLSGDDRAAVLLWRS